MLFQPNVIGALCDRCDVGSFHLHDKGCLKCFCSGVTEQCASSNWFRTKVSGWYLLLGVLNLNQGQIQIDVTLSGLIIPFLFLFSQQILYVNNNNVSLIANSINFLFFNYIKLMISILYLFFIDFQDQICVSVFVVMSASYRNAACLLAFVMSCPGVHVHQNRSHGSVGNLELIPT